MDIFWNYTLYFCNINIAIIIIINVIIIIIIIIIVTIIIIIGWAIAHYQPLISVR